jgi:hypothetical protein
LQQTASIELAKKYSDLSGIVLFCLIERETRTKTPNSWSLASSLLLCRIATRDLPSEGSMPRLKKAESKKTVNSVAAEKAKTSSEVLDSKMKAVAEEGAIDDPVRM